GYFTDKTVALTGEITANSITWSNETATVTLETTSSLTIQYKIGESGTWATGTTVTGLKHGNVVYARLTDGTNYGDETTINVLDKTNPTATISLSDNHSNPGQAITATVTHTDNESGVNTTSCKYVYNTTSSKLGTTSTAWNSATAFSSNSQKISLTTSTEGKYYLHVLTVDKAGNKTETVSQLVTVDQLTDINVTLYTDGTLGFSNNSSTISGKTVQTSYGNIRGMGYGQGNSPWYNDRSSIKTVIFVNKIIPNSTSGWFYGCNQLAGITNINNLNTSYVLSMSSMFHGCLNLTTLDVSNFDTSKVTDMGDMFDNCQKITSLNLSNFDTSKVTYMRSMFFACYNLTSLDLSNFDTSNVTDEMDYMFGQCNNLTSLNLSSFNTSKVTSMYAMFYNCKKLTNLDLSNFNTSEVTDMKNMFSGCEKLTSLDLSNFNTSNVTEMSSMFYTCSSLTTIYASSNFVTTNVTGSSYMFSGCSNLVGGNGTTYNSSYTDKTYARIDKTGSPGYFTQKSGGIVIIP
ncbi:MAG: BspA family leucine-rich repeat surface protein, partial [Clostridia bacterium]